MCHIRIARASVLGLADGFWIGPGPAALSAGYQQILARCGDNGRIPLSRDEANSLHWLARYEFAEIKDADRIGNRVRGKKGLLVRRERQILRIATAVLLAGELCRKIRHRFAARGIKDRDLVALGEGHEKPGTIVIEKESGRMRAAGKRRSRLAKRNEAAHISFHQIQLRDLGSIPERDKPYPAIAGANRRIRKRSRNALERREIETMDDFAVTGIQKNRFIRIVAGNQQTLFAAAHTNA